MTLPETTQPPSKDAPGHVALADYGISDAEWTAAVVLAERAVRQRMHRAGRGYRAEDAAALASSELWLSLPRWAETSPRPPLAAWARSRLAARNTVSRWEREEDPLRAPRGTMVLLDALPTDAIVADAHPVRREAEDARAIIHELRDRVLSQPGGAARWDWIVANVEHSTRGRRARAAAMTVLEDMTREAGAGR